MTNRKGKQTEKVQHNYNFLQLPSTCWWGASTNNRIEKKNKWERYALRPTTLQFILLIVFVCVFHWRMQLQWMKRKKSCDQIACLHWLTKVHKKSSRLSWRLHFHLFTVKPAGRWTIWNKWFDRLLHTFRHIESRKWSGSS